MSRIRQTGFSHLHFKKALSVFTTRTQQQNCVQEVEIAEYL